MGYSWILLSVCLLFGLNVDGFPTEDNSYIERLTFGEMKNFATTQRTVFHMEADLFIPGNILYSDPCALKTTNGVSTTIVIGNPTSTGYVEGTGDAARFNYIYGFFQLNKTHVIVTDWNNHCLRMVNRESQQTSHFSGICGSGGNTNGAAKTAKFYYPKNILLDKINSNILIVSQSNGYKIRAVDIDTGTVTTPVSSGISSPKGIAWDPEEDTLYVTHNNYITAVNWTSKQTTRLAGSTSPGGRLGDFKQALLYNPTELLYFKEKMYIFSDSSNRALKVMDIDSQTIGSVCVQGDCQLGSVYAMTLVNDSLYIYIDGKIRKLTGQDCVEAKNIYINLGETAATGIFDSRENGRFSVREYQHNLQPPTCSSYTLKVNKNPIVRRLVLTAEYNVTCSQMMLNNAYGSGVLEQVLKHKMTHYADVCSADCKMSTSLNPTYTCDSNVLRVVWPTDTVYTMNVKEIPSGLLSALQTRLWSLDTSVAELPILNGQTRYVLPSRKNGLMVQATLNSTCVQEQKHYQSIADVCL